MSFDIIDYRSIDSMEPAKLAIEYCGCTFMVHPHVKWIAVDEDGAIYVYGEPPIIEFDFWINHERGDVYSERLPFMIEYSGDWKDSLTYIGDQL